MNLILCDVLIWFCWYVKKDSNAYGILLAEYGFMGRGAVLLLIDNEESDLNLGWIKCY